MGYIGNGPYQGVLTGGNIQDGTVETTDLADGAVTTVKIADASVTATKLAAGAAVPSQSGQSGKYLTTDGSTASWDAPFEGGVVINESGADVDFRIESDTNTHALFLDGSNGHVGVGVTTPRNPLHVTDTRNYTHSTTADSATNMAGLRVTNTNNGDNWAGVWFATGGADGTHWSGIAGARTSNAATWGTHLAFFTHEDATSNLTQATERMRIDSSGRVTMPYQPSFGAYRSSGHINSLTDVVYNGTFHNVGNHYSTSTGRFTAPVTGLYHFYAYYLNTGGALSVCEIKLRINGSDRLDNRIFTASGGGSNQLSKTMSTTATLTAGDYVNVRVSYLGGTGAGMYGTGSIYCQFGGYLIG